LGEFKEKLANHELGVLMLLQGKATKIPAD
jgi:hypothetical protein